jgi:membrane associated rhomboid family serine protease
MTSTPVGMRCPECARQRTKVKRLRDVAAVPRVTYALIAMNVIAFIAEGGSVFTLSSGGLSGSVYEKGALLGSSPLPALAGQGVAHGQVWRVVTSGFLHENILHIGFNMWVLYVLGVTLEPAIGSGKFAVIYFVSLLTGSLGALLVTPHALTVGASGAVFGVMGASAVEMRARQIPLMQSGIGGLIVINLIISFSVPGISWGGHIGGLIGGTVAAAMLQFSARRHAQLLAYAGCAAIAVGSVLGSVATSKSSEVETIATGGVPAFLNPGS